MTDQTTLANRVFDELAAAFAPAAPSPRLVVLSFVGAAHQFARAVLSAQSDYPAHVVDFATGLLSEAAAFVIADDGAKWTSA